MATRVRQSTAAPTQRRAGNELPPYEKPSFPLNPAAQQALAQLLRTHSVKKLDESLEEAQSALSNAAAEINDRLTAKERATQKRKNEHGSDGVDSVMDEELEQSLAELRDRVQRMTERMDHSMRKMIDGRHGVQSIKDSIATASEDARVNAGIPTSTQHTQPQRHRRPRANEEDASDDDDDDEDYEDFEPTDPAINTQNRPSALDTFKSKVDDAKTRYSSHTLTARYADNNAYRDFRRVIHDAKHPDDEVPLPHQTEWFPEDGPPAPGVTTRARTHVDGDEEDEDDDIAVSRATVSTRCPISLTELKTPLTSRKCPHSFESEAILAMIGNSTNRQENRPNGERCVQCPVIGCSQMLTRTDLHIDNVLIRKIKRIQRARELENEDQDDDDNDRVGVRQTPTIIDDGDDAADVDDIVEDQEVPQTQMKREPRNTGPPASTAPSGSAAVVDLGHSTDDDEAEEEDTMEE